MLELGTAEATGYVGGIVDYAVIVQDADLPLMPAWRVEFINCMLRQTTLRVLAEMNALLRERPEFGARPAISAVLVAVNRICPRPAERPSVAGSAPPGP